MLGGEMLLPTRCGDGKLSGDGGAEYPCVRRYRHRRLLTFLWLQGFQATHGSMVVSESDAMMWVPHLTHLVLHDQWQDATRYLSRFLPPADTCCRRPTSVEAMVLTGVCNAFRKLANIVVAGEEDHLSKHYLDHRRTIYDGQIRLRSIRLNVQQARASIDWERVKKKAAEVLEELAFATPELKDLILMPGGPMKPHNVLPIGFGFRRRCRPRKQTRKPKSAAGVAKSYLVRWRRLPASSDPSQETYDQKLTLINTLHRIADIILDECLKAGKLQVRPLQTTEKEGAITAPLSQTMFGSLAGPVINPVVTSVEDAGALVAPASRNVFVTPGTPLANAGKLACHALTPGAQISSTVVGCLTSPAKNPELPLMSNAESGHQGLNISKNPREETTSCDEQDLHLKRQRTTGAFSHADGNLG
ncbi:hypothetical protein SORBI_3005G166432 [Sorghum bicolor]|uniref:Uncharacterized protein n=1 Tax=Sorghum bicolor TaxID=4558 RepID=A0A1Z5RJG8_SORBI|nr:hypothetical protein SORBI_3005G166432 [Sorghum bicolor]